MKLQELEPFDTGSNYPFNNETPSARPPRDLFNLSHVHTTTIAEAGSLIPILLLPTVPGDSFDISVSSLIRVLPQVVPLYSRQRAYIHLFYARYGDLWTNASEYMTKGFNGTKIIKKPTYKDYVNVLSSGDSNMFSQDFDSISDATINHNSFFGYVGFPIGVKLATLEDSLSGWDCLPLLMYQKIYFQYYVNPNQFSNFWTDWSTFRFGSGLFVNNSPDLVSFPVDEFRRYFIYGFGSGNVLYRSWAGDYFTTAVPSPQRGNSPELSGTSNSTIPSLDVNGTLNFYPAFSDISSAHFSGTSGQGLAIYGWKGFPAESSIDQKYVGFSMNPDITEVQDGVNFLTDKFNRTIFTGSTSKLEGFNVNYGISVEDLRGLIIAQDELERMAKTDGSYASFGRVFFGVVSRDSLDYGVTYVGGCYQQIQFNEVLQTSASTENSVLGAYAGHGISSMANGNLGHIDCDDYGYLMAIFSIMPDTYYSQGVDSWWTNLLQSEEFMPNRERMGYVPILNSELYISDEAVSTASDVFAYQSPFDYMRYMKNRVSGKIADKNNNSFFPYTQSRWFNTTPKFNASFGVAKNIRQDYLASPSEVAYTAQFAFNIRAVRPIPFIHQAAQILN